MRGRADRGETGRRTRRRAASRGGAGRLLLAVLIGLVGLSLLLWPEARNAVYDRDIATLRAEFAQANEPGPGESSSPREDLYQLLTAENERLFASGQAGLSDPFAYESIAVDLSAYGLVDNRIGFIAIPAIGIDLPIYLGASREHMKRGAVHLTHTSYPIGGINTNAVIAAHRGSVVVMFRDIDKIVPGDAIIITNFRERLVYQAVESAIIDPDEIDRITIVPDRDLITLLSCHPRGVNDRRIVVYAERVMV